MYAGIMLTNIFLFVLIVIRFGAKVLIEAPGVVTVSTLSRKGISDMRIGLRLLIDKARFSLVLALDCMRIINLTVGCLRNGYLNGTSL